MKLLSITFLWCCLFSGILQAECNISVAFLVLGVLSPCSYPLYSLCFVISTQQYHFWTGRKKSLVIKVLSGLNACYLNSLESQMYKWVLATNCRGKPFDGPLMSNTAALIRTVNCS